MTRTSRRRCIFGAFGALALGLRADRALFAAREAGLVSRRRAGLAFGTTFSLVALHQDPTVLAAALDESVVAIRRVHHTMSLFDPESAVSRLNRDGFLRRPDPWLVEALEICRGISRASAGAFDVTIPTRHSEVTSGRSRTERSRRCPLTSSLDT